MSNQIFLFKKIIKEMKKIKLNGIKGPQDKVENEDNVVGKLDKKHKKLWILRAELIEEGKEILKQNQVNFAFQELSESFRDEEKLGDITDQLAELSKLIEIVNEILWFEIRTDFNLWTKPFIMVRKGWKVAWRKEAENIPEILKFLTS